MTLERLEQRLEQRMTLAKISIHCILKYNWYISSLDTFIWFPHFSLDIS